MNDEKKNTFGNFRCMCDRIDLDNSTSNQDSNFSFFKLTNNTFEKKAKASNCILVKKDSKVK